MDISGISTSLNTAERVSSPARGELQAVNEKTSEAPRERGVRGRRGLALGILKQELAFRSWFRAAQSLGFVKAPATADDVADEALGAAKQIVAESPSTAAQSLVALKARVEQAATYAREAVSGEDDDIDDIVEKLEEGLGELEDEVANYRESSASVLAIDTRSRQRSTIQIRTQEGDVVKFSLKRVDSMSAKDFAYIDGESSFTATEVSVSSRSRMMMSVEGDLNEAELAAIQNVFAQAEMIADEFFEGDVGAAFNVAQGFEFDTEQLARVNMRFKMREATNVAYAETVRAIPAPPVEAPVIAPPVVEAPVIAPPIVEAPSKEFADIDPVLLPVAPDNEAPEVMAAEQPEAGTAASPLDTSALENFLDALGAFLRSVGEGFAKDDSGLGFRYHYSESFKLEMLKAVLHTVAPVESTDAADNAGRLIDVANEPLTESD